MVERRAAALNFVFCRCAEKKHHLIYYLLSFRFYLTKILILKILVIRYGGAPRSGAEFCFLPLRGKKHHLIYYLLSLRFYLTKIFRIKILVICIV